MKYALMKKLSTSYPIALMSRVYGVSASGYYAWDGRRPSARAQEEARLEAEIQAAHKRSRETYGPERLQNDLKGHGIQVGVHRIKRIRRKLGLRCKQKRKFKATTNSNHALPVAPNLLEQNFAATAPNQVWVTDITYIPSDEGWLYLAGHKDLFTGDLVGYAMSERMTQTLVSQSLFRAVAQKRPPKGLIHHSDRGSQYCSRKFRRLLKHFGMEASMSRRGNCYDNAPMDCVPVRLLTRASLSITTTSLVN